jgi:hypothetical protein
MFIYVIGSSDKQKIGISADVSQRLKSLQTGNPEPLIIHHTVAVPDDRAYMLEQKIHKELSYLRMKGEWFRMSPSMAKSQLDFAIIRWLDDPLLD